MTYDEGETLHLWNLCEQKSSTEPVPTVEAVLFVVVHHNLIRRLVREVVYYRVMGNAIIYV